MIRKRKTKAEQDLKERDADQRAWDFFAPKLAACMSRSDARALVAHAPLQNIPGRHAPGRQFYTRLAFFLDSLSVAGCTVPDNASRAERSLYLGLVARLVMTGELTPGIGKKIELVLRNSPAEPGVH